MIIAVIAYPGVALLELVATQTVLDRVARYLPGAGRSQIRPQAVGGGRQVHFLGRCHSRDRYDVAPGGTDDRRRTEANDQPESVNPSEYSSRPGNDRPSG